MLKFIAAFCLLLLIVSPARAAYVNVYGAPAFTPGVGGFKGGGVTSRALNDAGTAAGWTGKYDASGNSLGIRAVRWDASGTAAELATLGSTAAGYTNVYARAINSAGTVVGNAEQYDGAGSNVGTRAVRWNAGGTAATELGNLGIRAGFTNADARAINSAGTAVGYAEKYDTSGYKGERAVRWNAAGVANELGDLGNSFGSTRASAGDINDAGTAVGEAEKYVTGSNRGFRAVRWNASGTAATELGNLGTTTSGGTNAYARAINSAGTAVGYAEKYSASGSYLGTRAVRWDASGTAATELGTLGTQINYAYVANDAGDAAGYTDKGGSRAVRWDGGGTAATELGNLGTNSGSTIARAADINSAGFVVGYARKYENFNLLGERAVYWNLDGAAIDLNTLIDPDSGWLLTSASAISDTGWIAGVGRFDPDGGGEQVAYDRLFLMQVPATVPEPSTLSLLLLGAPPLLRRRARSTRA